jgi:hypothetical protein
MNLPVNHPVEDDGLNLNTSSPGLMMTGAHVAVSEHVHSQVSGAPGVDLPIVWLVGRKERLPDTPSAHGFSDTAF